MIIIKKHNISGPKCNGTKDTYDTFITKCNSTCGGCISCDKPPYTITLKGGPSYLFDPTDTFDIRIDNNIQAIIKDIYIFGNVAYINLNFKEKDKIVSDFTFIKNLDNVTNNVWYLSKINET